MNRRLAIRAGFFLVLTALAFWLYDIGKAHTLLPENRNIEQEGITYKAFASVTLSIDGGEEMELYPRDRLKVRISGRRHKLTVTGITRQGKEVSVTRKFRISHDQQMYLLSLPALLGESEEWLLPFEPMM